MMRYPTAARIGVAIAVSSIFIGCVLAQDAKPSEEAHVVKSPSDLKWGDGPPSLPKGLKLAVLHGDPGKAVPFTLLLKLPAGYKVPAHWHSQDENVLVVSGTFYAGMDKNRLLCKLANLFNKELSVIHQTYATWFSIGTSIASIIRNINSKT